MSDIALASYVVAASTSGGKFWEVEVEGCEVRTRYGKVGQKKKWSTKTYADEGEALKEGQKALRKKINKGYAEAPRPIELSSGYKGKKLAELPIGGVFYFRALDRYPGGNADMFTTKITLRHIPGEAPALRTRQYRNWDGQHYEYDETEVSLDLTKTLPALLEATEALVATGDAQGEFTVRETRYDREEYDTEWSSIEFVIYVLPKEDAESVKIEDGEAIAHLIQRAVTYQAEGPQGAFEDFFGAAVALTGVGRVEEHSEGKDAYNGACGEARTVGQKWSSADIPIYL